MIKKLAILVLVILGLGAWAGYRIYHQQPDGLAASGMIEVTRADITPKIGGYLRDLKIDRGDKVKAGQIVFYIERPDLSANLSAAKYAEQRARAQWEDLQSGPRSQEINEAAANVSALEVLYSQADSDLVRSEKLYTDGAIAAQTIEKARTQSSNAYSQLQAAKSRLALLRAGSRIDQITAAKKAMEQAEAQVQAAQSATDDMIVRAPVDGTVLTRNFEQGEYVAPGAAVATIGNTADCWLKVYIPSTEMGKIKIGQKCVVKIDSFPDKKFTGVINEIGQQAEFTPRQTITPSERANLVFYVKVKLDNSEGIFKAGMPADVLIK
ncbi:MAG: efflux RND transporter periplasmic adaptor subunit [Negativicutes bacterium]|jgi:HlyD family secretion protein